MKGSKILLVDDEVVFTTNMGKLLTNRGYKVTAANSGDAAIQALEKEHFDVVVLDFKVPEADSCQSTFRVQTLTNSVSSRAQLLVARLFPLSERTISATVNRGGVCQG